MGKYENTPQLCRFLKRIDSTLAAIVTSFYEFTVGAFSP